MKYIVKQYEYDVIVCGGGTAGVIAAIASSRMGIRTLMIEKNGFLGGTAVGGGPIMSFLGPNGNPMVGGIPEEIIQILKKKGSSPGHIPFPRWNSFTPFNPEEFKNTVALVYQKSGGDLLLHSFITDVKSKGDRLISILVQNGFESIELKGKVFIDATGDGVVINKSPAECRKEKTLQSASYMFRLGDFNKKKFIEFLKKHPDEIRGKDEGWGISLFESQPYFAFCGLYNFIKFANEKHNLKMPRQFICFNTSWREDQIIMVASRVNNVDPTDMTSITFAEMDARLQDDRLIPLLKKYIPGFENVYLLATGHQIGIRENIHIQGLYTLTKEDVMYSVDFSDSIALGGYPIDIHGTNGSGNYFILLKKTYEIPYRSMISEKCSNLIVAGRLISVDPTAYGSTRIQSTCMAIGQSAGTSAALAAKERIPVNQISVEILQNYLKKNGLIFKKTNNRI